jgi:prephenate dehydrogenase
MPLSSILMLFPHITIIGAGLIGGSLALAARRAALCEKVTGWNGGHSLDDALALGVIDTAEESFERGQTCRADLIYLAAPVGAIIDFLRSRGRLLKRGAIVTDAGSTKREICRAARESLPDDVFFVGGHPMAGSQKGGVEFADADLFKGAAYAITTGSRAEAVERVIEMVKAIGSRPTLLTAEAHDRVVACVSHAPQLLSTALALAAGREAETLAGRGLEDMTRLAASRWEVWRDICATNADEMEKALGELIDQIQWLHQAVAEKRFEDIQDAFERANELARRIGR